MPTFKMKTGKKKGLYSKRTKKMWELPKLQW